MKILALNTAFESLGLSLWREETLVANYYSVMKKRGNQLILNVIDELLRNAEMKLADLDFLIVAQGPGSYTGLRLGMSVAKTLAYVENKPLIGVDSLRLLASIAQPTEAPFYVLLNCHRAEVFYARFHWQGSEVVALDPIHLTTIEELWPKVAEVPVLYQRVPATGKVTHPLFSQLQLLPRRYPIPDAYPLLALGRTDFSCYEGAFPPVNPLYLKKDV